MMDTVLNLGLNDALRRGPGARRPATSASRGTPTAASCRCSATSCAGCRASGSRRTIKQLKAERGVKLDTELDVDALRELTQRFATLFREHTGEDFPQDPQEQLRQRSAPCSTRGWASARSTTAASTASPTTGARRSTSSRWSSATRATRPAPASPSAATRSPASPSPRATSSQNAQGEDVVSGVRNTRDIAELADVMPEAHAELMEILRTLERHYGDMQDTEFTIEEGRLYMLQTRNAKRPAQAAVRFAVDAVAEGLLTREQALMTIDAGKLDALLHPTFDPQAEIAVLAQGVAASPGAAKGEIVFTAPEAVRRRRAGEDVILVRPFTEADDVAGFHAARGILTSEGGKASHAALVARGMGRPCVCGASALEIDLQAETVRWGTPSLKRGDRIAIDGSTGIVTTDDVPLVEAALERAVRDGARVGRRAAHARRARQRRHARGRHAGARVRRRGDRPVPHRAHVHGGRPPAEDARDDPGRRRGARRAALAELLPLQQEDFEGLFEAMAGLPVTIRLLDPPLHEFLPHRWEVERELERARDTGGATTAASWSARSSACRRSRRRTRCSARAAAGWGSSTRRSTRCRPRRSRGGARGARADRRGAAARGDDPARRLRARARADARAGRRERRTSAGWRSAATSSSAR